MAMCIVTSCRSNNCELFCAPDDKNKLKKWQMTIGTKESEFLICERHFQREFIITEKSLASNAFPSLFLKSQDFHKDSACQSCLKQLSSNEDRKLMDQNFVDIFKKLGFEAKKDASMCKGCHEAMCNFQNILIIQEMKKNNPPPIKLETIELEDEVPLKPTQKPVEPAKVAQAKIVVYPQKTQSIQKEPPKEVPSVMPNNNVNNINVVQKNIMYPTGYSNNANFDTNQVQSNVQNPKMISISGPLKAIIKSAQQQTREYMIPLKDFTEQEKPIIATMRRQSAAPMTIIHNASLDKAMKDEMVSLKADGPNDVSFAKAVKRRVSVGTPTAVSQELKSPQETNLIRVLPSKEFRCTECLAPFATSRLLKYHEDNGLCDGRPQSSSSRALNSFKCFDCNNSFASYYFLRRHRETCTLSLRVKCTYQYCRFRATNPGDIQKHFNEVHAHKLKCKECDEILPSQAALIAHEVTKHGKEDMAKKRALKARQVRAAKRARADLDFDSNTVIECEQCSLKIQPRDLANHMALCKKK